MKGCTLNSIYTYNLTLSFLLNMIAAVFSYLVPSNLCFLIWGAGEESWLNFLHCLSEK